MVPPDEELDVHVPQNRNHSAMQFGDHRSEIVPTILPWGDHSKDAQHLLQKYDDVNILPD